MHAALRAKLPIYGQRTYLGARALEIAASLLGLATGIALGYQAFSAAAPGSITSMDLVLASAPFFMVAIAELTKIPIATLLFSTKWFWKPFVLLGLLALAGITFETVFMGLERAATLRQFQYEEIVRKIDELKYELQQLSDQSTNAVLNDKLKQAQDNLAKIAAQADQEHNNLVARVNELDKQIQGQRMLSPEAEQTQNDMRQKIAERDRLVAERNIAIRDNMSEFERQRDSFVDRIKTAQANGDIERVRHYQDELDQLANPRPRLEAQYSPRIDPLDKQIASLQQEFDREMANAPTMSNQERQKLEATKSDIQTQLGDVDKAWAERRIRASEAVEASLDNVSKGEQEAFKQEERLREIKLQLSDKETARIENARTDQIRRIAGRIYGLKPESVSVEQAGLVSIIWFGSLAMLAALAGPLTAIVALSLQNIASEDEKRAQEGRLSRAIRYTLLKWRWRRIQKVPVRFEVPVDREVEKRVEVPVEHKVTEILYVPILTDDPDAIRRALSDKIDKSIADYVKMSMAGTANGSPTQHGTFGTGVSPGSATSGDSGPAGRS